MSANLDDIQRVLTADAIAQTVMMQLGLKAQYVLQQQSTPEAAVAAFQDCFLLTAIVFILAMVPALFIRPQRRQVWRKDA